MQHVLHSGRQIADERIIAVCRNAAQEITLIEVFYVHGANQILLKCEQSALAALLGLRVRQFVNFCEILIVQSAVNRAVVKILKQAGQPPEVISDLSLGREIITAINQAAAE